MTADVSAHGRPGAGDAGHTPLVLALDAATYVGTVAVVHGGLVLAEGEAGMRGEREERLMPAVAGVLAAAGLSVGDVQCVACGAGPGSFTSLRIAASLAKGIARGRSVPLFARSSLYLIVAGAGGPLADGEYVAALDALRGEVYACALSVRGGSVLVEEPAVRLAAAELERFARRRGARVVGPGREVDAAPHARGFAREAGWFGAGAVVDLAAWEPDYGRLAEAQVKWEAAHGRPLASA